MREIYKKLGIPRPTDDIYPGSTDRSTSGPPAAAARPHTRLRHRATARQPRPRPVWEPIPDEPGSIVLGQLIPQQQLVVLNAHHLDQLEENRGRSATPSAIRKTGTKQWSLRSRT